MLQPAQGSRNSRTPHLLRLALRVQPIPSELKSFERGLHFFFFFFWRHLEIFNRPGPQGKKWRSLAPLFSKNTQYTPLKIWRGLLITIADPVNKKKLGMEKVKIFKAP